MLAATLEYSTPRETDRATVTSTLLTQIDDALTAAASGQPCEDEPPDADTEP